MDWLGISHIATAASALFFGPAVFLRRKGTRAHKTLGYAYVASMFALNISALMIYDLFDGFGAFHWAALASLATLLMGFIPAFFRRPTGTWIEWHYMGMCWSYVGLCAAAAAEVLTRLPFYMPDVVRLIPANYFWSAVGVSTFLVCGAGWYLINRRRTGYALVRRMLAANLPETH